MICPYCGSANAARTRLCTFCGQDLGGQNQLSNHQPPYTPGQTPNNVSSLPSNTSPQANLAQYTTSQPQTSRQKVGCIGCLTRLLMFVVLGGLLYGAFDAWTQFVTKDPTIFTYNGPADSNTVQTAIWSPNGQRIASADDHGKVAVWDATSGSHLLIYRGHNSTVNTLAWSPDGRNIASGSVDGTIQIWNAHNGGLLLKIQQNMSSENANSLAWSPDNNQLAIIAGKVIIWDVKHNVQQFTFEDNTLTIPTAVAWSPDGTTLAIADYNGSVAVLQLSTHRLIYTYKDNTDQVEGVAWSPNSQRIASGSSNGTVHVWDATTGRNVYVYHLPTIFTHKVGAVAWSPDGKRIASLDITSDEARVWDASNGAHAIVYHATRSLSWSPDSTRIASPTTDNKVEVWQPETTFIGLAPRSDVLNTAALGTIITIVAFFIGTGSKKAATAGARNYRRAFFVALLSAIAFTILIAVMIQIGWDPLALVWEGGSYASSDN